MRVLAGDVGGTNLRLACVEVEAGAPARLVSARTVPVANYPSLGPAAREFLADLEGPPLRRACLGVAGTITGRVLTGVNLPWEIDADALERELGLERLDLINDFHAAARGVEVLGDAGWERLSGEEPDPGAPIAILGAGTGLGQAFLIPDGRGGRHVVPTEGGHRDFAARSSLEDRLLAWLRARHGRVSTERVLSGPGLAALYAFLVEVEGLPPCPEVAAADGAPEAVTESAHATAQAAVEAFVDVYGAEAGNVALTVLARGGVYLAGGIAPRILRSPERVARFQAAFVNKGRFEDYLAQLPVRLITDPELGLLGAAHEASLRERRS